MKKIVGGVLSVVIVGLAACGPKTPNVGLERTNMPERLGPVVLASGSTLQSQKARIQIPEVSEVDRTSLIDGNNAFAFDLYRQLGTSGDNLFYSPYSISAALAMTYAGARSTTAEQMAKSLHFDLPQEKLHPAFNWLGSELATRGKGTKGADGKGFRLNIVNTIWGQKNFAFILSFLDTLAENYGAGLRILDFINDSEKSRVTINDWVSEQTEKRVQNLISPGTINQKTRLVLTNAIYFNAAWENEFPPEANTKLPFYPLNGEKVNASMMRQTHLIQYAEGENYQAVELPYDGGEFSMVVFLPGKGKFKEFEEKLDYRQMDKIINNLSDNRVNLTMPEFRFDSEFKLGNALSAMGMRDAFSSNANFSGITGNASNFFIGEVLHKAFVSVNQTGTEAAAATAVIMVGTPPPQQSITVTIDRPFIFLIREIRTGTTIFIGRIINQNPLMLD